MQFLVILLNKKKVLCVQSTSDFRHGSRLKECKLVLKVPLADSSPTRQKPGMHHRLNLIYNTEPSPPLHLMWRRKLVLLHILFLSNTVRFFWVRNPKEFILCLKLMFLKEINGTGKYFLYTHFALTSRSESL